MTIFLLFVGGLTTALIQTYLRLPHWIWLGYAACSAWAVVVAVVRRKEQTMMFHTLLNIEQRLATLQESSAQESSAEMPR